MRRFRGPLLSTLGLTFCLIGSANAANMVTNGSFEMSDVGTNWALFQNGTVPGWTSNNNEIEIDYSANTIGGNAYDGNQSAELDGTAFDTISQVISGLTIGQQYSLSWAYGDRPGSGQQQMNVYFGGVLVQSDFDYALNNSSLIWTYEKVTILATAAQETLSFAAIDTSSIGGNNSVGNELDLVALTPVPEPVSLALVASGLLAMTWAKRRSLSTVKSHRCAYGHNCRAAGTNLPAERLQAECSGCTSTQRRTAIRLTGMNLRG